MRNAKVELFDVALKGCRGSALDSPYSGTIVATRCEFANSAYGAYVGGTFFGRVVFATIIPGVVFIRPTGVTDVSGLSG